MNKKYNFETTSTPLAAFIRAKYLSEIEFTAELKSEENRPKRVVFCFGSDTIDFISIENIFLTSFANTYNNELMTLKNIVRTLIPFSNPKD